MSGYAMEWAAWIAREKRLDPSAAWVLVRIAEHAHRKSGRANPGIETIADETGYHVNTVRLAMTRLREAKVVDCEVRTGRAAVWWFPVAPPPQKSGSKGDLSTPLHERLGYPHRRSGTAPQSDPQTPTTEVAEQEEQELKNKKAPAAVAALPGDDAARPTITRPVADMAFAPGSGRLPNWSRGES